MKFQSKALTGLLPVLLITTFLVACGQSTKTASPSQTSGASSPATAAVSTPAASPAVSAEGGKIINYATSPVGTSVNTIANGVASVLSQNSKVRVSIQPVAGMNAWLPLLNSGEVGLGSDAAPEMVWAFEGIADRGYKTPVKEIRMIVRGNYINATGLVVRKDSGIKTVADLKGKRVATGYPGTAFARVVTEAVLTANGLKMSDVKSVPVATIVAGVEALRDNRVDATFALVPSSPVMLETHNTLGLQELNFIDKVKSDEIDKVAPNVLNGITSSIPGASLSVVKPEGYISKDTIAIKYPNYMVTSSHMSDDSVYAIMDTLWVHYEKLFPVHPWLKEWTPKQFFDPNPTLPYHPGAVKFLKDKGLWNDQVDKIQQELMKKAASK